MTQLIIAIPLPSEVKTSIGLLCYGLPSIEWVEKDNFHIQLLRLDNEDGNRLLDIQDALKDIYFPVFEIQLSGIGNIHRKHSGGSLWISITPSDPLEKLCRKIKRTIKPLLSKNEMPAANPKVTLAQYSTLSPQKLGAYLETNGLFSLPPFLVDSFCLLSMHRNLKNIIYIEEERFSLLS
jgi:2'-5' RNA ligase